MMQGANYFIELYRDPLLAKKLTDAEWDIVIRQSRKAQLLATLYFILERNDLLQFIPKKPLSHLEAIKTISNKHANDVCWEIDRILKALSPLSVPVIFLKGAAYVASNTPNSQGRLFHDVDILVGQNDLCDIEESLGNNGWYSTHLSEYDQRYYRQWMHELPPLKHMRRSTLLDVHHHIIPLTAHVGFDIEKLFSAAVELKDGKRQGKVLAPVDMVIHSIVHLFHDGEFDRSLRDLIDIDLLIQFNNGDGRFPEAILQRAEELGLERAVFYAFRYLEQVLLVDYFRVLSSEQRKIGRPNGFLLAWMDFLFSRAITAHHSTCDLPFSGLSRWSLYMRAHYLRMPPHLLVPHLLYKTFVTEK